MNRVVTGCDHFKRPFRWRSHRRPRWVWLKQLAEALAEDAAELADRALGWLKKLSNWLRTLSSREPVYCFAAIGAAAQVEECSG